MRTPLEQIRFGGCVLVAIVVLAVLGYRFIGGFDWMAAVWMVVITISTVGYGENISATGGGPGAHHRLIVLGISASVYTFGGLIQVMLEGELENVLGRRRMNKDILRLSDHTIICGYGRMGRNLTHELRAEKVQMVIIENDPDAFAEAAADGMLCVHGNATEEEVLETAGLRAPRRWSARFPTMPKASSSH